MKKSIDRHSRSHMAFDRSSLSGERSHSKSVKRMFNGIKLFNFSQLESYGKIHLDKSVKDKKKGEVMRAKLDFQRNVQIRTKQRLKHDESYVPYNYNPFSFQKINEKHIRSVALDLKQDNERRDIIHEINQINQKKQLNKKELLTSISKTKQRVNSQSQFLRKNVTTSRYQFINQKSLAQGKNSPGKQQKVKKQFKQKQKQKQKQPLTQSFLSPKVEQVFHGQYQEKLILRQFKQLDQITRIQEVPYSRHRNKEINIFRVLFHRNEYFDDLGGLLTKFYFSFNSTIEKMTKYRCYVLRDLSKNARTSTRITNKAAFEELLLLNSKDISFENLLGVVSGRYTAQRVFELLHNENKEEEEESMQVQTEQNNKRNNVRTNAQFPSEGLKEIKQYFGLDYRPQEIWLKGVCENRKNEINSLLSQEQHFLKVKIYDEKIHRGLKKSIDDKLSNYVESGFSYPKQSHQRNRFVERTKQIKKKNDIIKVKSLIQTYLLKKNKQTNINKLVNIRI